MELAFPPAADHYSPHLKTVYKIKTPTAATVNVLIDCYLSTKRPAVVTP
nr:MAG TPA: hypothetical protein [Caudoviricetes sp.]